MLIVSHNLESLNSPLTEITQMSFRSGTSQQKLHSRFETHWSTEQQLGGRDFLRVLQTCNLSIILFSSYAKSEINDQEVYLVQIEAESGKGKK